MNRDQTLQHFGVLGMHWGRRKASSHTTSSEDHAKVVSTTKGKKVHELSNAEIKAFNERMNLEKQYKELTKAQISPGRKFVTELINTAAKEAASKFVKEYTSKGIDDLLKKSIAAAK